jgi:hypothetical protein
VKDHNLPVQCEVGHVVYNMSNQDHSAKDDIICSPVPYLLTHYHVKECANCQQTKISEEQFPHSVDDILNSDFLENWHVLWRRLY